MSPSKSGKPRPRLPRVRHWIACTRIDRSPDGRHVSLIDVIHLIRPAPGEAYPILQAELCLFAQLTDGHGSHTFQLQVVFLDESLEETVVHTTPPFVRDLGSDPLAVHGLPLTLRNLPFERPGQYEVCLYCDGQEIAREPITLGEES